MINEYLRNLTLEFNREALIRFFRTKSKAFKVFEEQRAEYEDENFSECYYIGEITFDQAEKLGIYAFKVSKDLTERSSKKLQYDKGKRIIKEQNLDAGIFVFYDDNNRFRFSLITVEYIGTRRQFSHFKRFTYFVSPEETNKTFLQRMSEASFSSIEEIKEAFSVEKVTKEFYQELANWYFWALKETRFPPDAEAEPNGRNIALIRLITRLIFVWFMKQKGIIRKELFDKEFLSKILKDLSDNESTYYKAILQNLFFATLNTKIDRRRFRREERCNGYINKDYMNHSRFRYHNLFVDEEEMIKLFKDIPFLNGGLFECLDKRKDDESNDTGREIRIDGFSDVPSKQPYVPNFLFFSEEREVDLNEDYGTQNKKYKVRGLINILSSYNFTVDENTPVDEEVALDPELLGKVFENLLASYNPETSTTARKSTGSYYTPREVVDYMVRASLKEYLKENVNDIDEEKLDELFDYNSEENPFDEQTTEKLIQAINKLKVLDPAVGSGAFLMGMLHALVHILHKLDPHNERWKAEQLSVISNITDPHLREELTRRVEENFTLNELDYGRKLYLIQNCLYGVDIQPIAIQIAKLRFFISLLVDEKIDPTKENFGIEPLPNLETKLVAADTLVPLPKNNQMIFQLQEIIELENELKNIRNQYFESTDPTRKERLKSKDKELRNRLADMLKKIGFPSKSTEKIVSWNPYDTNHAADWFEPEWMFGVNDGFDIVIGNPPYIQLQKNGGTLAKKYQSLGYETFDRMGDIYVLFYERGIKLLKPNGHLCFITSNKWMRAGYGEKLRKFFLNYNPKILIDLGPDVFESATVDTNILLIQNSKPANTGNTLKGLTLSEEKNLNIERQVKEKSIVLEKLTKDVWFIGDNSEQKLKEKIESIGKPLKLWDVKIYRGVLTGLNEAFIITSETRDEILRNCKDDDERERTEAIIKPVLRGRDIERYYYEWKNLWLIYIPWHFPMHEDPTIECASLQAEDKFSQAFQALYSYLLQFKAKLLNRNKEETGVRYEWYVLQRCAATYYQEFEKEKIVWQRITHEPTFCQVEPGMFILDSMAFFTGNRSKFIMAILNSKVIYKYVKMIVHQYGFTGFRLSNQYVEAMPIPEVNSKNGEQIEKIEHLVNEIIVTKKHGKDTRFLEAEIDRLVYELYELTDKEISIIEKEK